jgi:Derlin-2/3
MPVVGLEAWFTQIPPVTRTWLALSVLTSVAVVRSPPLPVAARSQYNFLPLSLDPWGRGRV